MCLSLSQAVSSPGILNQEQRTPRSRDKETVGLGSGICKFQSSEAAAWQNELGNPVHGQRKPCDLPFGVAWA